MKRAVNVILLSCLISLNSFAVINGQGASKPESADAQQPAQEKRLTPSEMIDDINTMIATMEQVHPNLYCYIAKKDIEFVFPKNLASGSVKGHHALTFVDALAI